MANTLQAITAISLCAVLGACGGSGGSSDETASASAGTGQSGTPAGPSAGASNTGAAGTNDTAGNTGATGTTGATSSSGNTGTTGSAGTSGTGTDSAGTTTGSTGASGGTTASTFQVDPSARFNAPGDITIDSAGNLYVMDRGNLAIRRIAVDGTVTTVPGSFNAQTRLAMSRTNDLFALIGQDVVKVASNGATTTVIRFAAGTASYNPKRIAFDGANRLYVLRQYRNDFRVERMNADGTGAASVYAFGISGAYSFSSDGGVLDLASNAEGTLALPIRGPAENAGRIVVVPAAVQPATDATAGIKTWPVTPNVIGKTAFDAAGNLYLADANYVYNSGTSNTGSYYAVTGFRVLKIAPDGTVTTLLDKFPDGTVTPRQTASLNNNIGIAAASNGEVYLSDPFDHAIYKMTAGGVATLIAGKPGEAGNSD
jgi:hypothetical protein